MSTKPLPRPSKLLAILTSLGLLLLLLFVPPAAVSAFTADELTGAEVDVLGCVNDMRAKVGLRAYRPDGRVRAIARERSENMARYDYFGHTQPDGRTSGDLLDRDGIKWFVWGEAIGWNNWSPLSSSVSWQCDWWRDSPSHYALIVSKKFNYAGVGIAQDGSKLIYTIVFIQGPDRTKPTASMGDVSAASTGSVSLRWSGKDPLLATLTAGLANFDVQRRPAGGDWTTAWYKTTATSKTLSLPGGSYEFRVRSRDNRGNRSAWTAPVTVRVP